MTLILQEDYHALPIVEQNRLRWIPPARAARQAIRPLRIGILNIMPLGEQYEFNILHPLGLSVLQIEPIWIRLESHTYRTWLPDHVEKVYVTYQEAVRQQPLDGLILTGAPVETIRFEDVNYWEETSTILREARRTIPSTLGLCWAGFAMAYLEGVDKFNYNRKLFGIYPLRNLDPSHPVTGELDDEFWCPQSRHAGLADEAMEQAQRDGRLKLLAHGADPGYTIFATADDRFLAHTGHPIVGDKLYGHDEDCYLALVEDRLTDEQRRALLLPCHALHAGELTFEWRGREWRVVAKPESWFAEFCGG